MLYNERGNGVMEVEIIPFYGQSIIGSISLLVRALWNVTSEVDTNREEKRGVPVKKDCHTASLHFGWENWIEKVVSLKCKWFQMAVKYSCSFTKIPFNPSSLFCSAIWSQFLQGYFAVIYRWLVNVNAHIEGIFLARNVNLSSAKERERWEFTDFTLAKSGFI